MTMEEVQAAMEIADFRKMNQIRGRVDSTVEDEDAAEACGSGWRRGRG